MINNDPDVSPYLKFAFIPNYNVSAAQVLVPGSETSQHISTAGTEASGTSNMKFVMNGGLIVGTMDGANVEICEEAGGQDAHFIFGALEDDVPVIMSKSKGGHYPVDGRLAKVFQAIKSGQFSRGDAEATTEFSAIVDKLCTVHAAGTWEGDRYLVVADFPSYVDAQNRVDRDYANQSSWAARSIVSVSSTGKFSTDRSMADYAKNVWELPKCARPAPKLVNK